MTAQDFIERVAQQSMNSKIALTLKIGVFIICAVLAFDGKPPAHAEIQWSKATSISTEDVQQDIQLSKMSEWQINQEYWNKQTSDNLKTQDEEIRAMRSDLDDTRGQQKGWFGLLTALTALSVFFQLRNKPKPQAG